MGNLLQFKKTVWKVMTLTFSQLILLCVFCSMTYANDTKAQDILNKDVSLKAQSESVKYILGQIEQQTNAKFVYSDTRIKIDKRISVEATNQKLANVLSGLLNPLSINYQVIGNYIVLSKRKNTVETRHALSLQSAHIITGSVTNAKTNDPLIGATVALKGTSKGVLTDEKGNFTLALDDSEKNGSLVISFVGYDAQTIEIGGRTTINIALSEGKNLDEVVVTGVFDPRTRLETSTAVSILKSKDLERMASTSAVDLLKNIPGVFVNAGVGEIQNSIYTRGLSNFPNLYGYTYVSMQEDGLPVLNINNGVDYFLRADASIARVEALRGGSAAVVGANAPGGIFNYISKTGGETLAGEVRAKFGLEGDGKNPYYRADFNYGGPLNADKSLRFNVGGFYRQSNGAKSLGYAANNGGQIKANITKTYSTGSLKVYAKVLNDRNTSTQYTPTTDWNNQVLPTGFDLNASYDLPDLSFTIPVNGAGTEQNFDSKRKIQNTNNVLGLNWTQDLGNGFTLKNDGKISSLRYLQNTTIQVSPYLPTTGVFYNLPGLAPRYGLYTFTDKVTGKVLGTFNRLSTGITPGANNNFPGAANTLLFLPLFFSERASSEYMNQLSISKQFKDMKFTVGAFYAKTNQDITGSSTGSGIGAATVEDHPHLTDITLDGIDGKRYQVTNPDGFMRVGESGQATSNAQQSVTALFFGHTWQITDKLNLDWGARYESVRNNGWNALNVTNPLEYTAGYGGVDGNPLTLYDNAGGTEGIHRDYDKSIDFVSYSAGLNYKLDDHQAVYARFSNGNKSPEITFFYALNTPFLVDNTPDFAQKVQQFEVAYKYSSEKLKLFVTPFYSNLSNVANVQTFRNVDNSNYTAPIQYAQYETKGIEIEAEVPIANGFSIKAGGLIQDSKALKYTVWLANAAGPQDDVLLDYSGNATGGLPKLLYNIAPTYTSDNFYASLNYSFVGDRPANVANGFLMKGYSTVDLTASYTFSKSFGLQFNANNLLNDSGVLNWLSTGGFPNATNTAGVTPAFVAANSTAVFSTLRNQPRAYFLTATFRF